MLGSIIGAETATLVHNSESADNFEAEAKHIKESDLTESEGFHDILEQFSKVKIDLENENHELSRIEKSICEKRFEALENFLEG